MIRELEEQMWKAACARDSAAFLKLVDSNAVMVCGGYRCTGAEYAQIISQFDCSAYEISGFETPAQTDSAGADRQSGSGALRHQDRGQQ